MNKVIKKIVFNLFVFISFFGFLLTSKANTINSIEMDVYIDSYGNAEVTEVWSAYLDEGTEGYRPYTDLRNKSISDFTVVDDTNRTYENLLSWNVNASFSEKAYKSGLHYLNNGVELCWGISNYGNRVYTLKYKINNFVTQYTDTQGIYFTFFNLDQTVDSVKITIRSSFPFSLDNSRIWGYGNDGTINFVDGNIVFDSDGVLSTSENMTALIRFETNIFNTTSNSDSSFDQVYDVAMQGTVEAEEEDNIGIIPIIIALPFMLILNPFVWLIVYLILRFVKGKDWIWGSKIISGSLDFGKKGNELPTEVNYWRDIPCNKDLNKAYWVADKYNVVADKTLKENYIGAILLKWLKDKKITITKTKKGLFDFKDNNYAVDLTKITNLDNEIEIELLNMLKKAAGNNTILEAKEFEKYCKKHYNALDNWLSNANLTTQLQYEKEGLITNKKVETTGMFGRKRTVTTKQVSEQLYDEAIKLKGLMKFLLDFSIMPERQYFEVALWEEYLIYAQLLGIADKVEEQFSKLYPRFKEVSNLDLDLADLAIRNMVHTGYRAAEESRAKAMSRDYSGRSTSSGGGGRSYSGGGSSAGGSSGGGFR